MDKGNTSDFTLDPWFIVMIDPLPTTLFRDYLASMEAFLETESQKHYESLKAIKEKIELSELTEPSDPGQMPGEMEYDYYRLAGIEEFANILRKSCFASLYTALESRLVEECLYYEKREQEKGGGETRQSFSDITDRGIEKSMTFLIKVQRISFSLGESAEWREIQDYKKLRNCIVHNDGKLDERTRSRVRNRLKWYVEHKPTLSFSKYGDEIILDRSFCEETIDTVERFSLSVLAASRPWLLTR